MAVYSKGKRAKKQSKSRNKIITGMLVCIIIFATIYLVVSNSSIGIDSNIENSDLKTSHISQNNEQKQQNVAEEKKNEIVSDVTIPEKIGEYKVLGRLVIDKIKVSSDILKLKNDNSEKDMNRALEESIVRFYGPEEVNSPGNFCIAGHRGYQFEKLYTLKKRRYIIYD